MQPITLPLIIEPAFNVAKYNAIVTQANAGLKSIGKDFKPIDTVKFEAQMKALDEEFITSNKALQDFIASTDKAGNGLKGLGDDAGKAGDGLDKLGSKGNTAVSNFKSIAGGFLAASGIQVGVQALVQGVKDVIHAGVEYQASLADLSSITGVSGDALDQFGSKAQSLALQFGGPVTGQIEAFKGVLSRLGPDIAKSPEGLERMAKAINTLSAASGLDTTASMDALTNSMLQFNVDLADPVKAAAEMERMMNTLAAGAKEGAAEIPQVAEAIVVAGSAASNAKVSFEETNAAIQVIAAKSGKYGSEAGIALRNVIGLMQKNSKEAHDLTASMGVPFEELGKALATKGLGGALDLLKSGFDKLGSAAEKNAAMMQIFGMENAGFASSLMNNTDMLSSFTEKMTGTNTAIEQAAIRQDTLSAASERFSAMINVNIIAAFKKIEPIATKVFSAIGSGIEYAFKAGSFLFDTIEKAAPLLLATGIAYGVYTIATNTATISTWAAKFSFDALKATMLANPFTAIAVGAIALVGVISALSDAFSQSAEEKLADAEASIELNKKNQEATEGAIKQERANVDLIARYEALIKAKKEGKQVDEELRSVRDKLDAQYPRTIDLTKSHEENLKAVKDQTGLTNVETSKFTENNRKLVTEFERLSNKTEKTNQEKKRLIEVEKLLQKEFPGVIEGAANTAEGLKVLKEQSGLVTDSMSKLQGRLEGFRKEAKELAIIQAQAQIEVTRSKALEDLSGLVGVAWSDSVAEAKNIIVGAYNSITREADPGRLQGMIDYYKQQIKDLRDIGAASNRGSKLNNEEFMTATSALLTMLQQRLSELKLYRAEEKKVNSETTTNNTENDNKEVDSAKDKKDKIKSYEDEIVKVKQGTQEKLNSMSISALNDERERDIRNSQEKTRRTAEQINNEIKAVREKIDISESDRLKLIAAWNERLKVETESGATDILNIKIKHANREIDEARKKQEKLLNDEIAYLQKEADLIEKSLPNMQGGAVAGALDELGTIKINLIKKNGEKEINEYLRQNEEYKKAQESFYKTLADFNTGAANVLMLGIARQNLDAIKSGILETDRYVLARTLDTQRQVEAETRASELKIRESSIKTNTDLAQRSRDIKLLEAEKAYDEQIRLAQGNAAVELEAYTDLQQKKTEITKQYVIESAGIEAQVALQLANSLTEAFKAPLDAGNKEAADSARKSLEEIKKSEEAVKKQYREGQLNRKDYIEKLNELDASRRDELKKLQDAEFDFMNAAKEAFMQSIKAMSEFSDNLLKKSLADITKYTQASISLQEEKTAKTAEAEKAGNDGRLDDAKEFTKEANKLTDMQRQASQSAAAATASAYTSVAMQAGATFAKIMIEEKKTSKALLMSALDALQGIVAIVSAEILAKALATPASIASFGIAGFALWGGLTMAITAAVALAKATVAAKMESGGIMSGRNKLYMVNDQAGDNYEEMIFRASTTAKNKTDFLRINALDLTIEEYVRRYRPDITTKILEEKLNNDISKTVRRQERTREVVYRDTHDHAEMIKELKKQNELLQKQNELLSTHFKKSEKVVKSKKEFAAEIKISPEKDFFKVIEFNKQAEISRW